ncbi:MAG: hypothetical protein HQK66_10395, partial [Desulfamplus sp.]|nr:hypothetical protein [Desulfamplus sp.]
DSLIPRIETLLTDKKGADKEIVALKSRIASKSVESIDSDISATSVLEHQCLNISA